jgi:hypothetical protein
LNSPTSLNSESIPAFSFNHNEADTFEGALDGIASLDVYGAFLLQGFAKPRSSIDEYDIRVVETPEEF